MTLAPGSGCAVALLTAGRPCAGLRFQRVRERGGNVCFGVAWGRTRSRVSTRKEPPGEQFQRPPMESLGSWLAALDNDSALLPLPGDELWLSPSPPASPRTLARLCTTQWRCIDASHAAGCTACAPPPEQEAVPCYVLVGEAGKGDGEKRLRKHLVATAEWNCERARHALATRAAAAGLLAAVAGLQRKQATRLNKADLAFVLSAWGYASQAFVHKRAAAERKRRYVEPQTVAAGVVQESPQGNEWRLLRSLSALAKRGATGHAARAAAEACASAEARCYVASSLGEVRLILASVMHVPAMLADMHARLSAAADDDASALQPLRQFLTVGYDHVRLLAASSRQELRDRGHALAQAESIWLGEQAAVHETNMALFDAALALLDGAGLEGRDAGVALLELLLVHVATTHACFRQREAWMAAMTERDAAAAEGGPHQHKPPLLSFVELPPELQPAHA